MKKQLTRHRESVKWSWHIDQSLKGKGKKKKSQILDQKDKQSKTSNTVKRQATRNPSKKNKYRSRSEQSKETARLAILPPLIRTRRADVAEVVGVEGGGTELLARIVDNAQ